MFVENYRPMSKAAATRQAILLKAFDLIYRNGFQATSIDTIIATTQVTKGAFFYHFKNKEDMGLALINEVIKPRMEDDFGHRLSLSDYPAEDIYALMKYLLQTSPDFQVQYGCPVVNLVNEVAPTSDSLQKALHGVLSQCLQLLRNSVQRGQALGQIRQDIDAAEVADFIMMGYSGIRNMGKLFGVVCYQTYLNALKRYLQQLA
ncbi:TetR/AcrR family transcriptional regulator [Spirosoma lituiforme]